MKNTIKKMSRDFIGRNIRLELDELDGTVYVDEKWAEFVLGQILSNSIKYSKKSSAEIKMFGKRLEKCMMLTIQDNGVGIVPEDVDRVFEKGFTGINGRRFGSSTGMGLYICKKLCDTLGMKIYLSSKVDVGTEVRIIFPISQYTLLEP